MIFFFRIKFSLFLIVVLFPFLLSTNALVFAQESEIPFSKLNIGLNIGRGKNTSFIENYWEIKNTLGLSAEMPFYYGSISGGVLILPYSSKTNEKPDFRSLFIYLGLGKSIKLPFNTSFYAGLKLGNYSMTFDDDTINVNLKTESEFAAAFVSRFSATLLPNTNLNIGGDIIKVFTKNNMSVFHLSAGISYSFDSPAWIREIFE